MLPNEVLAQVFLQVDDPSTLYDLALCSRRIHEIVEPVLYSVFRDVEGHDLALFLRTILAKPHLRKHVRTFDSCDGRYYFFRVTGAQMHDTEPLFSMDIFGQEDWSRLRMICLASLPLLSRSPHLCSSLVVRKDDEELIHFQSVPSD